MGCGGSKEKKRRATASGLRIQNSKDRPNKQLEAKIVLVGNSSVGKTCIASFYKEGKFSSEHKPTVGAAYLQKVFSFPDGSTLKLHIWDTAGQEKFRSVAPLYYKDSHAALVVYAIDDESSFTAVEQWIE